VQKPPYQLREKPDLQRTEAGFESSARDRAFTDDVFFDGSPGPFGDLRRTQSQIAIRTGTRRSPTRFMPVQELRDAPSAEQQLRGAE
jgi:hypothetical protein